MAGRIWGFLEGGMNWVWNDGWYIKRDLQEETVFRGHRPAGEKAENACDQGHMAEIEGACSERSRQREFPQI